MERSGPVLNGGTCVDKGEKGSTRREKRSVCKTTRSRRMGVMSERSKRYRRCGCQAAAVGSHGGTSLKSVLQECNFRGYMPYPRCSTI